MSWKDKTNTAWSNAWSSQNLGSSIGTIGNSVIDIAGSGFANAQIADTSAIENDIADTAAAQFDYGDYDALMAAYNDQALQSSNYNRKDVRGVTGGQMTLNTGKGMLSGAVAGAKIGGPWGAVAGAAVGLGAGLAGIFTGNSKANLRAAELNNRAASANQRYLAGFANNASTISENMFNDAAIHMAANGGKIKSRSSKYVGFDDYFAYGGGLDLSGEFSNGVTIVGEGGSHESNKYEGVPMGMDENGVPNLVEEGEVVYNDYVFSRRLKPTKSQLREILLNPKYEGKTFADIAKLIQKESSENPFDPISRNTLDDGMMKLMTIQEMTRNKKNINKFALGGKKYAEGGIPDYYNLEGSALSAPIAELPFPTAYRVDPIQTPTLEETLSQIRKSGSDTSSVVPTGTVSNDSSWVENLRYAPAVASGLQALSDVAGWTNKNDYTNPNLIRRAARNVRNVSARPIGATMTYTPFAFDYEQNRFANQSLGIRNAILASTSGNRGAAIGSLLALNNATNAQMGDLALRSAQANLAQRNMVNQFDANIAQANSQLGMQADARNQAADMEKVDAAVREAILRDQIESATSKAKSANYTNLANNLGNVGLDSFYNRSAFDWIRAQGLEDQYKNYVLRSAAKGGKIKRGLTF